MSSECVWYLKALLTFLYIKKDIFDNEDGETLKEVVQTDAGHILDWDGWGSEQPHLVEEVPAYCRGVDDL